MKKGKSAAYLKKLRKKYKLGEFRVRKTGMRKTKARSKRTRRAPTMERSFQPQFGN
jgi:hypothetical protein